MGGDKIKYLREQEINHLIKSINGLSKLAIIIAAITGKRISEIVNLRVKDVSFHDQTITFRILKRHSKKDVLKTKYYPNNKLFNAIKKRVVEASLNSEDFLFKSYSRTGHLRRESVHMALKKQGVNLHSHLFRHSVGYRLAEKGYSAHDIKEYLDHALISSTEHYLHVSGERVRKITADAIKGIRL